MPEREQAPSRGPAPASAGTGEKASAGDPGGQPPARISATPAAREAIRRLRAARGEGLMFVQSAGCCAGSLPMCFPAGEYITGGNDLMLGTIEGCPFYIDARIYRSWDDAELILDVAPGDPEGFPSAPPRRALRAQDQRVPAAADLTRARRPLRARQQRAPDHQGQAGRNQSAPDVRAADLTSPGATGFEPATLRL